MRLLVQDDYEAMSCTAADLIAETLRSCRTPLLVLASGATPTRAYQLLGERQPAEPQLFEQLRIVKLDEWGDLPMDHPASCETYVARSILRPWKIARDRYLSFQSNAPDPQQECERVQAGLDAWGPIDLCVLGLGANGHLGFNEPGELVHPFCHVAMLTDATRRHPMLADTQADADYGLTLGMAAVFRSRNVLLLVSGRHKSEPMQRLWSRRITTQFPASLLWLHPRVTCVCDRPAAAKIESLES